MMMHNSLARRQQGAALLVMMLVVIVGAAALLVSKLDRNASRQSQSSTTQASLASAKQALLAYAMSYPDRVSGAAAQLPCPDIDTSGVTLDGEAHEFDCGAAGETMLGRLPWKTLGIAALTDGAGECLWYAVSGDYKSAGAATAAMLNPDSSGQLELLQSESGAVVQGQTAASRPVALIIASGPVLGGQTRQALGRPGQQCSDDFNRQAFLDDDAATGVSNASVSGSVAIEQFVLAAGVVDGFNDRVLPITRRELAELVYQRHDFETRIRELTHALAQCLAAHGKSNPGGVTDLRLAWPSPVPLTDYRVDSQYDDAGSGILSGRLSDVVDDSNALTGNATSRVLTDCSPAAAPLWDARMLSMWQNWKDHYFLYVADAFSPAAAVPSSCGSCLTVDGSGQYAAVLIFANRRLQSAAQSRDAPPFDADTRDDIGNYLESRNTTLHPYLAGNADLESRPADATFNDILYCLDTSLTVSAC